MSAMYDIDFEHVFPDLSSAERFVQKASALYQRTELTEYDGVSGYYWQVRVVVQMVPTHAGITCVENELESIAASFGGRSDGWGLLDRPA